MWCVTGTEKPNSRNIREVAEMPKPITAPAAMMSGLAALNAVTIQAERRPAPSPRMAACKKPCW